MRTCRTCMSRNDLSPLFGEYSAVKFTSEQLFLVTGVKIELNDGLPQSACKACIKLILKTLDMRSISIKVDQILRTLHNKHSEYNSMGVRTRQSYANDLSDQHYTSDINAVEHNNINSDMDEHGFNDDNITSFETVDLSTNDDFFLLKVENVNASDKSVTKANNLRKIKDPVLKSDKKVRSERKVTNNRKSKRKDEDVNTENVIKHIRRGRKVKIDDNMAHDDVVKIFEKRDDMVRKRERRKKLMSLAVTPYPLTGPIQCKQCLATLKTCSSFRSHAATHFEPEFPCQHCDKKFHGRAHLLYHQERKHGRKKRLGCDKCDFRAVDRLALLNHERAEHTGERPYVCDECGAAFRMRNNLKQHLPKHYGIKNMQCELCPKRFILRSELWGHQMKVHYMTYTYNCYLCRETYKTRKGVRNHIAKVHGVLWDNQPKIDFIKTRKLDVPHTVDDNAPTVPEEKTLV